MVLNRIFMTDVGAVLDLAGRMRLKSHVCTRFATKKVSFTSKCRLNFYLFGRS